MHVGKFFFSWDGRIARRHWWGAKVAILLSQILAFVAVMEFVPEELGNDAMAGLLAWLAIAPMVWADVVTTVKRLHDRGRSGAWFWMTLVPMIGPIWIVIECGVKEGQKGPNQFGPSPDQQPDLLEVF